MKHKQKVFPVNQGSEALVLEFSVWILNCVIIFDQLKFGEKHSFDIKCKYNSLRNMKRIDKCVL